MRNPKHPADPPLTDGDLARLTKMLEVAGRATTPDGEALNAVRHARRIAAKHGLTLDGLGFGSAAVSAVLSEKDQRISALQRERDALAARLAEAAEEARRRSRAEARRPSAWMAAALEEARVACEFPHVPLVNLRRLLEGSMSTTVRRLQRACESTARALRSSCDPPPPWALDTQRDLMTEASAALAGQDEERCLHCLRAVWLLFGSSAAS